MYIIVPKTAHNSIETSYTSNNLLHVSANHVANFTEVKYKG